MNKLIALLLLVACSGGQAPRLSSLGQAGAPVLHLWAGLRPGNYAVGFRSTDNTWYPAAPGGELLRFRDYVPLLEDVDVLLHAHRISDAAIVQLFDTRMYAKRDAPIIEQNFPVVHLSLSERQTAAGKRADAIVPEVTTWDFAGTIFPEIGRAMHGPDRRHIASAARKVLQLISAETSRRPI